jgi:hypothetical protein
MLPRGRVYRYPPGRNLQGIPLPGVAGGTPMQALATALANAPPEQQRTVRPVYGYCFTTFGCLLNCFMWIKKFSYRLSFLNEFIDAR